MKKTLVILAIILLVTSIFANNPLHEPNVASSQHWMSENLKVTHYRNGDPIPNVTENSIWFGLSTGAYCVYNNDLATADTYGNLYNWYAVDDARGLVPAGWRGTNEGSKLSDGTIYKWNARKFTEKVKGNIIKKGKRS